MRLWTTLLICVMLLLAGCSIGLPTSDGSPPPITLANTAPSQLDAAVDINIGGYDVSQRGMTSIGVHFLAHGRLVLFQKGETLACGGAAPVRLSTGIDQSYPSSAVAGKMFSCLYTSGKTSGVITFQIPMAPVLLSPAAGATVARSAATPIHFQAGGGALTIVVFATDAKGLANVSGPGVASVDTSRFTAGSGGVLLNQSPTVAHASANAFASYTIYCVAITQTAVIWR